jgi:hypothetical protein
VRRESSTVVVVVGAVGEELLAELGRSPNVSIARAPGTEAGQPGAEEPDGARPGWEAGALALREAARRVSAYVVVADDPLADVAAAWRAMWDVADARGAAGFEDRAAEALAAWRDKRFELPDYYLVVAEALPGGTGPDLYLGPLRAARPRRVAVAVARMDGRPGQAARVLDALRSLEHGPWWPPLDELIGVARRFYAGGLAETQPVG